MENAKQQQKGDKAGKLAVVLIRNTTEASSDIRDTLKMLGLDRKFTCRVLENNPRNKGMLDKVKDYTASGEIDAETEKLLEQKRGKRGKKGKEGKTRKDFHLSPPRGGFERKGIKHSFEQGGAIGYRGNRMAGLIRKMV
jgi:large subunit ribosomal protein L30